MRPMVPLARSAARPLSPHSELAFSSPADRKPKRRLSPREAAGGQHAAPVRRLVCRRERSMRPTTTRTKFVAGSAGIVATVNLVRAPARAADYVLKLGTSQASGAPLNVR